ALGQLADLREVATLDASDVKGAANPIAAARAVGASEVLTSALTPAGDEWQVKMRRWNVADSSVRWTADFAVTRDPRFSLAEAVRTQVVLAYGDHRPRPGVMAPRIEPADYESYLRL